MFLNPNKLEPPFPFLSFPFLFFFCFFSSFSSFSPHSFSFLDQHPFPTKSDVDQLPLTSPQHHWPILAQLNSRLAQIRPEIAPNSAVPSRMRAWRTPAQSCVNDQCSAAFTTPRSRSTCHSQPDLAITWPKPREDARQASRRPPVARPAHASQAGPKTT